MNVYENAFLGIGHPNEIPSWHPRNPSRKLDAAIAALLAERDRLFGGNGEPPTASTQNQPAACTTIRLVPIKSVAEQLLGCSVKTLQRMAAAGKFPAPVEIEGKKFFAEADIRQHMEQAGIPCDRLSSLVNEV